MSSDNVHIIAIGVEEYEHLPSINGPKHDLALVRDLFCKSSRTALYPESKFECLLNPTVNEARHAINEYAMSRTAGGDILLLYFSGHGCPLAREDFGFCMTDTATHPVTRQVLPMTVLEFSDIMETLSVSGIHPVMILDACYSGEIGHRRSNSQAERTMHHRVTTDAGTAYAFLCACRDWQQAFADQGHSVFTAALYRVAQEGLGAKRHKCILSLSDVFGQLREYVSNEVLDMSPILHLGETLPDFDLFRNTQYRPRREVFGRDMKLIVEFLYQRGRPYRSRTNTFHEISQGAYCNNNKLSYQPWALLKSVKNRNEKQLSRRGIRFAKGQLKIPKVIVKESDKYIPEKGTQMIAISDIQ